MTEREMKLLNSIAWFKDAITKDAEKRNDYSLYHDFNDSILDAIKHDIEYLTTMQSMEEKSLIRIDDIRHILSTRTYNALKRQSKPFDTLGDVYRYMCGYLNGDLKKLHNLGNVGINEIKDLLLTFGMVINDEQKL